MKYIRHVLPIILTLLGLAACSSTPPETFDGTWQSDNFKKVFVIKLKPPRECQIELSSDPDAEPIACLYDITGNKIALHLEIETLVLEYSKETDTLTWVGPPPVRLLRVRK